MFVSTLTNGGSGRYCRVQRQANSGIHDASIAMCDLLKHMPLPASALATWRLLGDLTLACESVLTIGCSMERNAVCLLFAALLTSSEHGCAIISSGGTPKPNNVLFMQIYRQCAGKSVRLMVQSCQKMPERHYWYRTSDLNM